MPNLSGILLNPLYGWVDIVYTSIYRYSVPALITIDNVLQFETEFKHIAHRLGIKHIHTSVQHPASNAAVERLMKTVKNMLTAHIDDNP